MLLAVSQAAARAVERALFTEITESKSLSVHCLPARTALHCTASQHQRSSAPLIAASHSATCQHALHRPPACPAVASH